MSEQLAPDLALERRHRAALAVLRGGLDLDGELLLSYVVWPTGRLERALASDGSRRGATRPAPGRSPRGRSR